MHSWFIISFKHFFGLVKAVFGEMVCLSWIDLGTGGSWIVCWQWQMMFVDSDRRWLLTATDDQFVDRYTIYWQLTVWFWNDDSHCEIRGQRSVDICYYGVGGRITRTRCLVHSAAFCCRTCFLDSGSNRYLRRTVESICERCIQLWFSIIHTSCADQHPSEWKWTKMPSCRANQWASSLASEKLVKGCPGHLVQQQSGHSICWFPPPTRQAAHRGRASKKSHMHRSLMPR